MLKEPAFRGFDLNQTENELIEEMGNVDGGSVDITLNDLSKIAGLGNDENYISSLEKIFQKLMQKVDMRKLYLF